MSKVPPLYFSNQWNFLNVIQLGMLKLRFTIGPDHLYPKNSMSIDFKEKKFKDKCCSWSTSKKKAADMQLIHSRFAADNVE